MEVFSPIICIFFSFLYLALSQMFNTLSKFHKLVAKNLNTIYIAMIFLKIDIIFRTTLVLEKD